MNKKIIRRLKQYIYFLVFCCTPLLISMPSLAFSPAPEDYTPANWTQSNSATNDAQHAIENDDLRLLGFAGRGFNIPGVKSTQTQTFIEKCGVRYFDEFSDVIREREDITNRQKASAYAVEYNQLILEHCLLDQKSSY